MSSEVLVALVKYLQQVISSKYRPLYLLSFILMLYRAPVDTSPVTEGVTLFKHQLQINK